MANDPLKILGISPSCTLADVRERYRILCLKYHPDKNPGTEDIFREVTEAYTKIRNNPGMLTPPTVGGSVSYLDGYITLTMKDFYYAAEKTLPISRYSLCSKCEGTGAKGGKAAVCTFCDGIGILDSNVLSLLGRDSLCPVCKGSGIMGEVCPSCHGEKRFSDNVNAKFRATLHVYYHKHVMLKGMGNAMPDGTYEDLMVRVRILEDPYVAIDGKTFDVVINVTPTQRVIGDKGVLDIFDRKIPYEIRPGSTVYDARDNIRFNFYRDICIRFREYIPDLTPETTDLYQQVNAAERKSCQEIGQKTYIFLTKKPETNTSSKP